MPPVKRGLVVGGRRAPLAIRCRLPFSPQLGEGIELGYMNGFTGGPTYSSCPSTPKA